MITRRNLLKSVLAAGIAPAIVRAESIMRINPAGILRFDYDGGYLMEERTLIALQEDLPNFFVNAGNRKYLILDGVAQPIDVVNIWADGEKIYEQLPWR